MTFTDDQHTARKERDRKRQQAGAKRKAFIAAVRQILARPHGHPIEREAEIRAALAEMDRV